MLCFLDIAKKGINMNLITFCRPAHIYQSDSCPFERIGNSDKGFCLAFQDARRLAFWGIKQPLGVCPRPTGAIYAVGPCTLEEEKNGCMCFDD
jgi:hypothetical protein